MNNPHDEKRKGEEKRRESKRNKKTQKRKKRERNARGLIDFVQYLGIIMRKGVKIQNAVACASSCLFLSFWYRSPPQPVRIKPLPNPILIYPEEKKKRKKEKAPHK